MKGGEGNRLSDEALGLTGTPDIPADAGTKFTSPYVTSPESQAGARTAVHVLTVHAARAAQELAKGDAQQYGHLLSVQASAFRQAADRLDREVLKLQLELGGVPT